MFSKCWMKYSLACAEMFVVILIRDVLTIPTQHKNAIRPEMKVTFRNFNQHWSQPITVGWVRQFIYFYWTFVPYRLTKGHS